MIYQLCNRCVMDSTDPLITFDRSGYCSYCSQFFETKVQRWHRGEHGLAKLRQLIDSLKRHGRHREFDAVLGLSGGIDSSYLALRSKDWGLRLLAVHVDGGWNSETAVSNIEKLVDYCGYELFTYVVDWSEMKDLQLAYLKSGVTNQDVPQDHAYFAALYGLAVQNRVPTILSGGNLATEGIAPDWMFDPLDVTNLEAIHRQYGSRKLERFPRVSFWQRYVWYPMARGLRVLRPLNYLDYNKQVALADLKATVGWMDYGRKHGESRFTKFYQNYYLPNRGYDKRRPHLSSLVVSGQLTRSAALTALEDPLYLPEELRTEMEYVSRKLGVSESELRHLVSLPPRDHRDFPNQETYAKRLRQVQAWSKKVLRRQLSPYS